MANTASAKKRIRQNEKRRLRNRWYRGRARTSVKKARAAIEAGNWSEAEELVREACRALDKAAGKDVIHRNNAARRKSRLMAYYHKARSEVAEHAS